MAPQSFSPDQPTTTATMARHNGFLSSDDELTISEPTRYEFESYHSEDAEVDDHMEDVEPQDTSQQSIPPVSKDDEDIPTPVVHRPGRKSKTEDNTANGSTGVRLVEVEVQIPRMSRSRRSAYKKTAVAAKPEPIQSFSPRRLRVRKQVRLLLRGVGDQP